MGFLVRFSGEFLRCFFIINKSNFYPITYIYIDDRILKEE